ncbi:MAG: ankyrin repeat domain-containing protein, partial [Verrucomicrobiota bacterium]
RVDSVPRGIALDGSSAWVLNAVANTVSLIDISNPAKLAVEKTIVLDDPTHPAFKRGRIAFNTAFASTTQTFSCASCHPDGHTDQLLWVLKTPIVSGGDQIMPRSTMPIRGLRDTAPFHWDGIPGDPYGGNNSAKVRGHVEPNSDPNIPETTTRHLIDGGLAGTMAMVGAEGGNDEGKPGLLSAAERDDMAKFLLSVTFPPAQRRSFTNELSDNAEEGFKLFHLDGNFEDKPQPNVCGDCHRMPFWVSTNTPGSGMDAPTWRGAYDRFLILPQGRLNIVEFPFYREVAERGNDERSIWRLSWRSKPRFDPVWDMVLEGSTGFSGAFARQVSLNQQTADDSLARRLLDALETSADEGGVVLQCEGSLNGDSLKLQFANGSYFEVSGERRFNRPQLMDLAKEGDFVGTFTGRHGAKADYDHPQPALWTLSSLHEQSGRQKFPILHPDKPTMTISGRHIRDGASIIVNGRRVEGSVDFEDNERLQIELAELPSEGLHFLQLQNPDGLFSNDFIFHVAASADAVADLQRYLDGAHRDNRTALTEAAARGNLDRIRTLLGQGSKINARKPDGGSTALSEAGLHGQLEAVKLLINRGAKVDATNEDGNTPLHVAAFLCEREVVQQLLDHGAPVNRKNHRGETTIAVVSGEWSQGLANFYRGIGASIGRELDLERIRRERPEMAKLLREHASAN